MAAKDREIDTGLRSFWGVLLIILFVFSALSLLSYSYTDIGFLHARVSQSPDNYIGTVGAHLSFGLFMLLGVGAYVVPLWCLMFGLLLIFNKQERIWGKAIWCAVLGLSIALAPELNSKAWEGLKENLNINWTSGILGLLIMKSFLVKWLSTIGASITLGSLSLLSLVMVVETQNIASAWQGSISLCSRLFGNVKSATESHGDRRSMIDKEERKMEKQRRKLEKAMKPEKEDKREPKPGLIKKKPKEKKVKEKKKKAPAIVQPKRPRAKPGEYQLPPISLLQKAEISKDIKIDADTTSKIMVETLADFGIDTKVTHVDKGPVVTRYELLPAPGVRVEKISGLANNLALSLKAHSVRVQAPVPGKGVVGIEVPNSSAQIVTVRDVVESTEWHNDKIRLPLVLGKDVAGNVAIADLASMPHLLIAGATGAGKTVCMNAILSGLLMAKTPDELRLILVDPKIVEFTAFKELPHLVVPVITNAKKVSLGLRWAINEMEKRYKMFAKAGVRNIEGFNNRVAPPPEPQAEGGVENPAEPPAEDAIPAKVPYIVIVVDELADLMLANQAEIENCIARLAQLSRAVGIHMILSTQRPSVNVITGTIKANFPARIAFQVAQKVDSRTILDTMGAEKLLGNGDMLYLPPATSKLVRIQGSMMYDEDINNIVGFIKNQAEPNYNLDIMEKISKPESTASGMSEDDDMLEQAIQVIRETQRASTSSLQRRLRIGYTRAARIMDILEEQGTVGPPRGSDPREILIDLDGEIPNNAEEDM